MKRIFLAVIAFAMPAIINSQTMNTNVDFNIWPKGELNTGYAQYFIGNKLPRTPRR